MRRFFPRHIASPLAGVDVLVTRIVERCVIEILRMSGQGFTHARW
jgi:hypothetical protein